jgi:adenylate cyclase
MAEERAKRKLTAILSADVKGYSRLMGEDEKATVETLKTYREVLGELIRQYRGRVVDSPGDNVLSEFASVVDAVECAVKIQEELKTRNEGLPENRRMEFRIGVHHGDVIEDEERIYGDGVNVAARIEGLAEGGGICISRTSFDSVKNKLNLGYEYLGDHTVKNIAEPVRVYKVLMEPEYVGKVIGEERLRRRQWRWAAIGGVVVLIIVIGALAIWNFYFRPAFEPASPERMAFSLPDAPSIAVLPFTNMSGDPKQEYLSDGFTEQIITSLSRDPRLFVIARYSTFTYKGKAVKVQQVAEELGVRYVLEGSVQKAAEKLRITAQLIDAITGRHLWAERYDRDLKEIFKLQDEVTVKIMSAVGAKLTRGEQARLLAKGTENLDAYLKVLEGYEYWHRHGKEGNLQARKLAEEAIALDPNYPSAHALLGSASRMDVWLGLSKSREQSLQEAVELLQKALAIDESHPIAGGELAYVYVMQMEYEKAIAQAEQAVALNPNSPIPQIGMVFMTAGRHEEAIQSLKKTIRIDPKGPGFYFLFLGHAYRGLGRYEEAIEEFKKAVGREPDSIFHHIALAGTYSLSDREEEARAEAAEVLRIDSKFSLKQYARTIPWRNKEDAERFVAALRKAGLPEEPPLPLPDKPSIAVLPFVNMSGDPEQEYFSDGISEEIITALSKTPKLFVIARTSSFRYKGKEVDVRTVGRELGVSYVLEGSFRKADDKVRITAQLVDAKTGNHVWAQRYDRDLKDIFALQDEITMKVIRALRVKLTEGEQARLMGKGTNNLEAYLKNAQSREYLLRFNRDDNVMARQLAQETIALDSDYPGGYNILAATHLMDILRGWTRSPGKSIEKASELVEKALALDDSYFYSHNILARIYLIKRQHEKAIAQYERALELNPSVADAYSLFGVALNYASRPEEAIELFKKALRLNPIPPSYYLYELAAAYRMVGQYEDSIATYKKALDRDPNHLVVHAGLTATYSVAGRLDDARAQAAEVLRVQPNFSAERYARRWPYKDKAETERLIDALLKAGLK